MSKIILTADEQKYIAKRKKELIAEYPYLKESGVKHMLEKALILEILINREEERMLSGEGNLRTYDSLVRTYILLMSRMGLTYVSKQRKEEKIKPRTPLDFVKEDEENEVRKEGV